MYEFYSLYSAVIKANVLSGFWSTVDPSLATKMFRILYTLYMVVTLLPGLFTFVCNCISAASVHTDNTRMIAVNFGTPLMLYDFANVLVRGDRLYSLTAGLDSVVKTLTEDELLTAGGKSDVFSRASRVNLLFKCFVIPFIGCPILTAVYTLACYILFQSKELIYAVPYDIHRFPFLYELTLLTQTLSGTYACFKCIAGEGLYFCLLFHLVSCLKALRASSEFIFHETDKHVTHVNDVYKWRSFRDETCVLKNSLNLSRFKAWIKVHNEIIR